MKPHVVIAVLAIVFSFILAREAWGVERVIDMFAPHESERPVLIIAHRGVNHLAPENSVLSISKAVDLKLDFVEIDVRTTKDGRLVLMHNSGVSGVTDGRGEVSDLTYDEVKRLDAGIKRGEEFRGTRIPSLEEAFATAKNRINVYLDWKTAAPEVLSSVIENSGMIDQTVVYGTPEELMKIQKTNPMIRLMPQVSSTKDFEELMASELNFDVVASNWSFFNSKLAEKIHAAGKRVFVDILNEADNCAGVKRSIRYGADAIQTDRPDMVLKCIGGGKNK